VVPSAGSQVPEGEVLPHHKLYKFSCHSSPLTYANSLTYQVVVSALPFTATAPKFTAKSMVHTFPAVSTREPPVVLVMKDPEGVHRCQR
jgi:hypothetical protein